jgi:hypothetical protein
MKRLMLIALALIISACATPKVEMNAEFYYKRGIERFVRGDYDKAISDYTPGMLRLTTIGGLPMVAKASMTRPSLISARP